ncbi:MAG TPA: hypothetical protein VEN81_11530, partial [Planctomycetota bacterium]|nr:hypothetical protein [Planctomycetota bacterium]
SSENLVSFLEFEEERFMKVQTKVVPHLKNGKCPSGAKESKAGARGKLCFIKASMGSKKPSGKK